MARVPSPEPSAREPSAGAELDALLLTHALREVQKAYQSLNDTLFGGSLRPACLAWSENAAELGAWFAGSRALNLNAKLVRGPWGALIEVLKHEMAHQFVSEVLAAEDDGPHGPVFRKVCEERGIDARGSGSPQAGSGQAPESLRVLERVSRLLSLAASDNRHEAEAAMTAARRLMLKHNIQEATLGASDHTFRHLGTPTQRRQAWQRTLANILCEYFFVEVIIVPIFDVRLGKNASVIEICGTPTNLEVAAYAHDFLERAATELWLERRRNEGSAAGGRNAFLLGVMTGFRAKLERERKEEKGAGLIWVGDPLLGRYFRRRHPYIRSVSGRGVRRDGAFTAGHAAGESLVFRRGMSEGPSGAPPRLLRG
jgi:hypothetical protein